MIERLTIINVMTEPRPEFKQLHQAKPEIFCQLLLARNEPQLAMNGSLMVSQKIESKIMEKRLHGAFMEKKKASSVYEIVVVWQEREREKEREKKETEREKRESKTQH